MKTELFTVSRLYNQNLFRIPIYQRGYSWGEKHLKDFWQDIEQLGKDKNHYTGVLTLESVPESVWSSWEDDVWIIKSRRFEPYYVVDGQQRLTTITILIQCILEANKEKEINFTSTEDVRKRYIFENRIGSKARSYIFGYEKDNPSYEYLKTKIFMESSDRHSPEEDTIYTKNLRNAKLFFSKKIEGMAHSDLELLYSKVTLNLVFNVYEISKEIDVYVAFETMNNRGKPLSTLELLKNRLIYLATYLSGVEGDGDSQRRVINDAWKSVYHYLGKNEKRPLEDDLFLKTHLYFYYNSALTGDVPSDPDKAARFNSQFFDVLDRPQDFFLNNLFTTKRLHAREGDEWPAITPDCLYEYSQSLKQGSDIFFKLSTPEASSYTDDEKMYLERMGRLRGYSPSALMFAVYIKEKDKKRKLEFLKALERWSFVCTLRSRGRVGYGGYQVHSEVIKYIKNKSSTDAIATMFNNQVSEMLKEDNISELLHDWAKNGPSYYGWRSINYFLFEYELYLASISKASRLKIDWDEFNKEDYKTDYHTVEHIYPQQARSSYWSDRFSVFNATQKRVLRNSLGNLLALSRPKNASLSNKPFPEKVGKEGDAVGYRFGGYSENEVASSTEWGPTQIVERGIKMLDFMERRWDIKIGDRAQKIKALGINFAVTK